MLRRVIAWIKGRRWGVLVAPIFLLFCGVVVFGATFSPSYRTCVHERDEAPRENEQADLNNRIGTLIVCESIVAQDNNGAITAVATFFVALFTFTLWSVTGSAVRLAHDEFRTKYRPRIITRSFEPSISDDITSVTFVFVNTGDVDALVTEIGTYVGTNSDPGKIFFIEKNTFVKPITGGDRRQHWIVDKNIMTRAAAKLARIETDQPTPYGNYIVGYIKYSAGTRSYQTGFCRKFNPENGRWVRQTESEYEYAD